MRASKINVMFCITSSEDCQECRTGSKHYLRRSVSFKSYLKKLLVLDKKIIFWMNQGQLYIVALVVCKGNCWRDVEVIYNDQLQSRETPAVSPVFDHPWRTLQRKLKSLVQKTWTWFQPIKHSLVQHTLSQNWAKYSK